MPTAPGLRVPINQGQQAIQLAIQARVIDQSLKVKTADQALFIPLTRALTALEHEHIAEVVEDVAVLVTEFNPKPPYPSSILAAVKETIPPDLHEYVPKSFDIIGRVALVKIPPQLMMWQRELGQAMLMVHRNLETVLAKVGHIEGEWRLRHYTVLAGTGNSRTIHKEYGCVYHLDPRKAYFSPRLSEERRRIATQTCTGEVIVDMFTSIGAYAIQIATTNPTVTVYAIDINPEAYPFLQRNVAVNHVSHLVFPRLGDVRDVAHSLTGRADRVIMDCPEHADDFVDVACQILKPTGGIIHFYGFAAEPTAIETVEQRLKRAVHLARRRVHAILYSRKLRPIAPRRWQIVVDALIHSVP